MKTTVVEWKQDVALYEQISLYLNRWSANMKSSVRFKVDECINEFRHATIDVFIDDIFINDTTPINLNDKFIQDLTFILVKVFGIKENAIRFNNTNTTIWINE